KVRSSDPESFFSIVNELKVNKVGGFDLVTRASVLDHHLRVLRLEVWSPIKIYNLITGPIPINNKGDLSSLSAGTFHFDSCVSPIPHRGIFSDVVFPNIETSGNADLTVNYD